MENKMYCWECHEEVEVEIPLSSEEVRYPNDDAHPAEYGEPFCTQCHSESVSDYVCNDCRTAGAEDELLVEDNGRLVCHKCFARRRISEKILELTEDIAQAFIKKFNHEDNADTLKYVDELIFDKFNNSAKMHIRSLISAINELQTREAMASDVAFEQYKKFLKEQSDNAILRKALDESNKRIVELEENHENE